MHLTHKHNSQDALHPALSALWENMIDGVLVEMFKFNMHGRSNLYQELCERQLANVSLVVGENV